MQSGSKKINANKQNRNLLSVYQFPVVLLANSNTIKRKILHYINITLDCLLYHKYTSLVLKKSAGKLLVFFNWYKINSDPPAVFFYQLFYPMLHSYDTFEFLYFLLGIQLHDLFEFYIFFFQ